MNPLFKKAPRPTAPAVALKDLEAAELALLESEAEFERAQHHLAMMRARVARLKARVGREDSANNLKEPNGIQ